ncbi:MAG TPA: hypothetical protein VFD84_21040 [Candidatus Binatia bacterium]|nr:hypothetical protein [Candidatus Binatia bacterium]
MRPAALVLAAAALACPAFVRAGDLLDDVAAQQADVEQRVREILVHRLEGDARALAADVARLEARDEARRDRGLAPTGLTDDVRYLAASLAPTRDAARDALHAVLRAHPDDVVRHLAEHRLEADDAEAANRILSDDRHNRRAAIINDAVRPLGVFSGGALFAAINPILLAGSAVDSIATTAVNLWNYNRLSTPEREALARYRQTLVRQPRTQDAPEIARAIRRLGAKRAAALCAETVALGKKALGERDLDHAVFYLRTADGMEGCGAAARPLAEAREALARRAAREEAGRWPVDEPPEPETGAEADDYHALLVATALGEPGAMIEAASRFLQRHDDSDFAPSARYVVAVARDLAGHHDEAKVALEALARDGRTTAGRAAAGALASVEFRRVDAIADAERRHFRDTLKYVFLGGQLDGRTALHSGTQLAAQGVQAAESLGIFNVIGVLTRAWTAWRKDPVSNQAIIDRGEEFLARQPEAPEANEVHEKLAAAYERAGQYGRALMHYRATRAPDPGRVKRLEAKMAADLLEQADKGPPNRVLLTGIVDHFPETKAADKARKRLGELPPDGDTTLDKALLLANPTLLGPDGLDLDPALLDGDRKNGELADAGVALADGALKLTLDDDAAPGHRVETRRLSSDAWARAKAAAQEALYESLVTADRRDPEIGPLEKYVPVYVQGSFGDGGLSVAPAVKMRRYRSTEKALYE